MNKGQMTPMWNPPPMETTNRVDVNLIAMLLWQSLLTGTAVGISHMGWYLSDAPAGEMGLQYGLIAFGFLCTSMVLFQVGGVRDSMAMRAEFSKEASYDKWFRQQMQMQNRRMQKQQYYADMQQQMAVMQAQAEGRDVFGLPNTPNAEDEQQP
jgi:hypothetical protein|tara:strand:- start:1046 stop:1504 length:459 start_codon:yes stop_codon:yes gene_type:complete